MDIANPTKIKPKAIKYDSDETPLYMLIKIPIKNMMTPTRMAIIDFSIVIFRSYT